MRERDDWRLTNQLLYLKGAEFSWRAYRAPRPDWDHDHCEFCWVTFTETDKPDALREGYGTANGTWVCETCFQDFNDLFEWKQTPYGAE